MELTKIKGNTYYIPSPANIGVYVRGKEAAIIDSGNDKEAGKKILRIIEEKGWKIGLIINTHSNADHIGGNAYLQDKTGCRIAATRIEKAFIEDPILEPSYLHGGNPVQKMRSKFLLAQPSLVTDVISPGKILDTGCEALDLPGHFFGMIGILTPDDVFFLADTIFSLTILTKYPLFFLHDIKAHLETLEKIKNLKCYAYVPSHAEMTRDIRPLVRMNSVKIDEIISVILDSCSDPATAEEILRKVSIHYDIPLNESQYILILNTIRSYLTYLEGIGRAGYSFKDKRMEWKKN